MMMASSGVKQTCAVMLSVLLLLLHFMPALSQTAIMFKRAEKNKRLVDAPNTQTSLVGVDLFACSIFCKGNLECVAFNYYGSTPTECELLSTAATTSSDSRIQNAPNWSYYTQHYIKGQNDPCVSNPCAAGSFCVGYHEPVYERYSYSSDSHMCSTHSWLAQEHNAGRTACHQEMLYNVDHTPDDIGAFRAIPTDYVDAFDNCYAHTCLAVLCNRQKCWLKSGFATSGLNPNPNFIFWYPVCT